MVSKRGKIYCSNKTKEKEFWEKELKNIPCDWLIVSISVKNLHLEVAFTVSGTFERADIHQIADIFFKSAKKYMKKHHLEVSRIRGIKAIDEFEHYRKFEVSDPNTWAVKYKNRLLEIGCLSESESPVKLELNFPDVIRD
jgi:hypothetical protein